MTAPPQPPATGTRSDAGDADPEAFPTARGIAEDVRSRRRSALDAVEASLARIAALDGELNAFHEVFPEEARAAAAAIDARVAAGEDPGPLAGVPVAIKDNICTRLGTTTCGSRMLEGYRSPFDATCVERLVAAGAVIVGRTNCDEFAMGSSTEHCAWGPTRNPWDPSRVPGGSSGGSAAAVAAGMVPLALGSDTGGSIRQPAALCGITGVKPTYGRVSRWGLVAFGSSLDQVGPFTRDATDAAIALEVLCGHDPLDSTSLDRHLPDLADGIDERIDDLRLAVPRQYRGDATDPAVAASVEASIAAMADAGAEVVEVDLSLVEHAIATYYVIAPAEASSNLARYDGIRYGHRAQPRPGATMDLEELYCRSRSEGFGREVQRRIMLGTYVLSAGYYDAYYKRALQVRRLIAEEYAKVLADCHAIVGPTSPIPAFPIGAKADPLAMYMCDVFTAGTNIAGIPGLSLPCGTVEVDGRPLPVGLQLQCRAFDERTMLRLARAFERLPGHGALPAPIAAASRG